MNLHLFIINFRKIDCKNKKYILKYLANNKKYTVDIIESNNKLTIKFIYGCKGIDKKFLKLAMEYI